MIAFIDEQRDQYGVELICKQLPIAVSTYYAHKACQSDSSKEPNRLKRDRYLEREIKRVWEANHSVYGARKVWRQLQREGISVTIKNEHTAAYFNFNNSATDPSLPQNTP